MKQKLIIIGAGESGCGAAVLGRQQGYDVFVTEAGEIKPQYLIELNGLGIPFEQGGHNMEKILAANLVVKSPGIPEKAPVMKAIRRAGIPVISELEFAYRHIGEGKIVAITGSNGKTTTTALLHFMCEVEGLNTALVGNIGHSIARQVALNPVDWYITEVSSFQLDDIVEFRPHIAILTNITEDHLDRYDYKMTNYIASKFKVIQNQTSNDYFIYCADDPETIANLNTYHKQSTLLPFTMKHELRQGAYIKDEEMLIRVKEQEVRMNIHEFKQAGKHNQYNTMAAGISARVMGIRDENIREAVQHFEGLPHRNEFVATIRGVDYVNDSKSTNINSTWYALGTATKPVVLILGGVDKGNDYSIIEELVEEKVKGIICMGLDNQKIHDAFKGKVGFLIDVHSAREAVETAYRHSTTGDMVLLSPACASFDLFKNYEDRGDQFKTAVNEL